MAEEKIKPDSTSLAADVGKMDLKIVIPEVPDALRDKIRDEIRKSVEAMSGRQGEVSISLSSEDFERLSLKTTEVLNGTALALERIAKDQGEIEQFKTETRAMLMHLRAA